MAERPRNEVLFFAVHVCECLLRDIEGRLDGHRGGGGGLQRTYLVSTHAMFRHVTLNGDDAIGRRRYYCGAALGHILLLYQMFHFLLIASTTFDVTVEDATSFRQDA